MLNQRVKIIVRSPEKLPDAWKTNDNLQIITASVLDLTDDEMREIVKDCDAVASCLGHNLSWKGIYGQPRELVTDATRRFCDAIKYKTATGSEICFDEHHGKPQSRLRRTYFLRPKMCYWVASLVAAAAC